MTAKRQAKRGRTRVIQASGFQPDYVKEVANAYARNGHAVEVIGGDMHAHLEFEPGVSFLNLRGRDAKEATRFRELRKLAYYYLRLLRHVLSADSRVLYDVSIGRPFLRCMLMYTAFRLARVKVIYTAHNLVPHDGDTVINRVIHFIIYRVLVDAIIVHGEALKASLSREFGVSPRKVTVVPIGTYHPANDPLVTKTAARNLLGIPPNIRVVLMFGFQRPYKGTHFVLEVLASRPIEDLHVLVRGKTTSRDYRERLSKLIDEIPECCAVDAVFAPVPDFNVEILFKASDVVLLPYLEGSQSAVKFLAYAYGRPVLCSDLGSLAEFVQRGRTGEVFRPGDPESFAATLRDMLERLETYDEDRIREIAYSEYSFESAMGQVEAIYVRLERAGGNTLSAQEDAT